LTAVGKTAIVERFVKEKFVDNSEETVGGTFFAKKLYFLLFIPFFF
jgi:GTPase SAR1 family protein